MHRQAAAQAVGEREFVDLAIAVARDVGEHHIARGLLFQAVDRHDGEDLVDRPKVRQALEDAEVPVVVIGEHGFEALHLAAVVVALLAHVGDPLQNVPIQLLAVRALAQVDFAVVELAAQLVAVIDGVVVDLLKAIAAGFAGVAHSLHAQLVQIAQQGGGVLVDFDVGDARARFEAVDVENVDHQHAVVGHDGAAGLRDDVRMRHARLRRHLRDRLDHVGAVFFGPVVAARSARALLAVVADRQTAAEIEDAHASALLHEAHIHTRGLGHRLADRADVRDLRTLVVMKHAQAIEHALVTQMIHHLHELRDVQAENARITAAAAPVACALRAQAEADAQRRPHAHFFAALKDELQLRRHLQHQNHLQAHLLRIQRQIDELLVLVAIAHDVGLRVVHVGQRRDELWLAASFEAIVILPAVAGDLLDHLLLLVHLDRVNTAVNALILRLGDRGGKTLVQFVDATAQQIAKTHQQRELRAALAQIMHDGCQRHGLGLGLVLQIDDHIALPGDVEVSMSPFADAVEISGLFGGPGGCFHFGGEDGRMRVEFRGAIIRAKPEMQSDISCCFDPRPI